MYAQILLLYGVISPVQRAVVPAKKRPKKTKGGVGTTNLSEATVVATS
jgi:hypothetical protein